MPPDSKDSGAGTALKDGPDASGSVDSSGKDAGEAGNNVISRAEHERLIAEERKRRSGQESAHQREMGQIREELNGLRSQIQSSPSLDVTDIDDLLARIDSGDPREVNAATKEALVSVSHWTKHLKSEQLLTQAQRQVSAAVEEAVAEGVPRSSLDTSSAASVRTSAQRWRDDQEKEELRERMRKMEEDLKQAKEEATMAVTRERTRSGASQTPVSTGSQPGQQTPDEERLQELQTQLAMAKRRHNGAAAISLGRDINALRWEIDHRQ